jgi:hypothetical protein
MGTKVDYLSINAPHSVFILKDPLPREKKENGTYLFAALIDGSATSMDAITYIA